MSGFTGASGRRVRWTRISESSWCRADCVNTTQRCQVPQPVVWSSSPSSQRSGMIGSKHPKTWKAVRHVGFELLIQDKRRRVLQKDLQTPAQVKQNPRARKIVELRSSKDTIRRGGGDILIASTGRMQLTLAHHDVRISSCHRTRPPSWLGCRKHLFAGTLDSCSVPEKC